MGCGDRVLPLQSEEGRSLPAWARLSKGGLLPALVVFQKASFSGDPWELGSR